MAIPILKNWKDYFDNEDEGLGSSYERVVLNRKLQTICKHFAVKNVLEIPSFGFTGISGINSVQMAKNGISVSLADHEQERLNLIESTWKKLNLKLQGSYLPDYNSLPFEENQFDFSWNFSALWFVENLENFLAELARVTSKVIFINVPNRTGIGFLSQKFLGKKDLKTLLKEENIFPENIKKTMHKLNWQLIDSDFIDCPPWPDIGMSKENFLKNFGLDWLIINKEQKSISIMNYYRGIEPDFEQEMMKYYWFEKSVPNFVKRFWAHHRYFLFIPEKNKLNTENTE